MQPLISYICQQHMFSILELLITKKFRLSCYQAQVLQGQRCTMIPVHGENASPALLPALSESHNVMADTTANSANGC